MTKPQKGKNNQLQSYARYSGMAFQLFAMLFVGYIIGNFIDQKLAANKPIATALCLLLAIFMYLFAIIKSTNKP